MKTISLNEGWRFYLEKPEKAKDYLYWEKAYNDQDWGCITLPHDWSITLPFSKANSSGTGYVSGGVGWYRCRFQVPDLKKDQKIWLVFDGIYKNSQIWINGYYLGKRPNGYIGQRYDITPFIDHEGEQVIAVKVSHDDIADSRWFTGSGLYRKVTLEIQEAVYLVPDSLMCHTHEVDEDYARASVTMALAHDKSMDIITDIQVQLINANNEIVYDARESIQLAPRTGQDHHHEVVLHKPHLWSAEGPYLYTLLLKIIHKEQSDNVITQQVGFRTVYFDPSEGMKVNGKPTLLKGVCLHHDGGCLGAAMVKPIWERRLIKLKALGCNAIRGSHNPHMPELYALCDELGFYMIDEAFDEWEGPKNKWSTGHNVYPPKHQGYYEDFHEWHKQDLVDMIRQNRKHPSVIMWSIGNEIDYPNDPYGHPKFEEMTGNNDANKPKEERIFNPNRPDMARLATIARSLTQIVKSVDTTRPVTIALAFPELSTDLGILDTIDVVGYNYKEQYYETDHQRFPDKPFFGSENGHHIKDWHVVTTLPYIFGQFLWTGIDYLGEAHGWPIRGSGAGLLTLGGFEKSSYYVRKAMWSSEPYIKLLTAYANQGEAVHHFHDKWDYLEDDSVEVRAYTNEKEATLFLNGTEVGVKKVDRDLGYASWHVPYTKGSIRVQANQAVDELRSVGAPAGLVLELYNDTSKWVQIEVSVVDSDKETVKTGQHKLVITTSDPQAWIALENGDLSDLTPYTENYRLTYAGKLLIIIRKTQAEEPIEVVVQGEGLKTERLKA